MNTLCCNRIAFIPPILTRLKCRRSLCCIVQIVQRITLCICIENLNVVCRAESRIRVERAGGRVAGAEEEVVQKDAFGVADILEVYREHVPPRLDRQRLIAD